MTVPPSAVTIRPATDADMDAVAAIYAHHVLHGRASFETEPPTAAEMRRRRAVVGKGCRMSREDPACPDLVQREQRRRR